MHWLSRPIGYATYPAVLVDKDGTHVVRIEHVCPNVYMTYIIGDKFCNPRWEDTNLDTAKNRIMEIDDMSNMGYKPRLNHSQVAARMRLSTVI